jgi:hypothetical protein
MEIFELEKIAFADEGKKIMYQYTVTSGIAALFDQNTPFYAIYGADVSSVPISLSVIPLIGNIAPIAWFAGFKIEVDELDEDFYNSLTLIKAIFKKNYPDREIEGSISAKKLVKNGNQGDKTAMLFSGGVDAFATYIRIVDKNPDLVTIHGADIEIEDKRQWNDFLSFNASEKTIAKNPKEYIQANLRDFYTYKVDLLVDGLGWWGKVQHGLGLICLLAPISYLKGYSSIYIASSYTDHISINWGSTPEIDQKISWSALKVIHDGYALKRQDKIDLITSFAADADEDLKLRVCYSELNEKLNCSHCEKCYRTILGIILSGKNPNNYGFKVDEHIYDQVFHKLEHAHLTEGGQYFWWELMEKAKSTEDYFIFKDEAIERENIARLKNGEIDQLFNQKIEKDKKSKVHTYKFILRNRFPGLYTLFQKIKN